MISTIYFVFTHSVIQSIYSRVFKMSALCLGQSFSCFEDLDTAIKQYQTQNFCVLVTKDSRSIEAAQKRLAQKKLNPALKYNELKFACHHGGYYRKRATNKDLRETTTSKKGCPFVIHFKTSEDGQQLVLKNWITNHNHEITEEVFTHHHRTRKLDKETEGSAGDAQSGSRPKTGAPCLC